MSDTFAKRLALALHHSGLTQQQLADALDIRAASVSAWMQTDGPLPRGTQLVRMPELLGVSGHWLLTGQGPMRPVGEDAILRLDIIGRIADGMIDVDQFANLADYVEELQAAIEKRAKDAALGKPRSPREGGGDARTLRSGKSR